MRIVYLSRSLAAWGRWLLWIAGYYESLATPGRWLLWVAGFHMSLAAMSRQLPDGEHGFHRPLTTFSHRALPCSSTSKTQTAIQSLGLNLEARDRGLLLELSMSCWKRRGPDLKATLQGFRWSPRRSVEWPFLTLSFSIPRLDTSARCLDFFSPFPSSWNALSSWRSKAVRL